MRKSNTRKEEKWSPLFEIKSDNVTAQGTFKSEDTDGSFYGYVNLIFADLVCVKCSLIEGQYGAFFSFPSVKKGNEYYSQVVPMNKDIAKELQDLAKECAEEFDR